MTAPEFVVALKEIPVDTIALMKRGLTLEDIERIKESYRAIKKTGTGNTSYSENPVLELVENYDCSQLMIGMIEFDEIIEETEDYIFFGKFEIDDLAINRVTGEIVLIEAGLDHILSYCAGSGERFLDAIFVAAKFLNKRGTDRELYNNEPLNIQMAEECGDAAGGEKYYDFYRMMFGV